MRHIGWLAGLWLGCLSVGWLYAVTAAEDTTGKEFINDSQHKLVLQKADADSNLDLRTTTTARKHGISLSGYLQLPEELDVTAISTAPISVEVKDERDQSCLAPVNNNSKAPPEVRYSPVLNHVGKFEMRSLALTKAASLLREIKPTFNLVVVRRRTQVDVEAKLARDMTNAGAGLQFRIESLRTTAEGRTTLTFDYRRPKAGAGGAIIETVTLLDGEGQTLATAHWNRGSPFELQGKLTVEYDRVDATKLRIARVGLVAEYDIQTTTFNLGNPYVE